MSSVTDRPSSPVDLKATSAAGPQPGSPAKYDKKFRREANFPELLDLAGNIGLQVPRRQEAEQKKPLETRTLSHLNMSSSSVTEELTATDNQTATSKPRSHKRGLSFCMIAADVKKTLPSLLHKHKTPSADSVAFHNTAADSILEENEELDLLDTQADKTSPTAAATQPAYNTNAAQAGTDGNLQDHN